MATPYLDLYTAPMGAALALDDRDERSREDHFVVLHDVSWADYRRIMELRGERGSPRIAYADGWLQLMTPSRDHESLKSLIGRLVEVYCLESGLDFSTYGSWTLENERLKKAVEPDECYVFGDPRAATRPDLVIEVEWSSRGRHKLDIYRALGVCELWFWRKGVITPHVLRGDAYVVVDASEVLPGLDLALLASFLDRPTTSDAIRAYRAALTARG